MAGRLLVFLAAFAEAAPPRRLAGSGGTHSHNPSAHYHTPHSHTPQSHSHTPHTHSPAASPQPSPPPSPLPSPPSPADGISERFIFVDEASGTNDPTGSWSPNVAYSQPIQCAIDGTVVFRWTQPNHDVVLMQDEAAYNACDFTNSTTLASAAGTGDTSYYLPCTPAGSMLYVSCSVGSHCQDGQKVAVNVSSTTRAVDHATGEALVHVTSLARVMKLMGAYEPASAPGTALLPLGYNSETAANTTLEFVWCLTPHCPESARTYHPEATLETCRADIFNLGGFIVRSKPHPEYSLAAEYYQQALASDPNHCPTLEYKTELHLQEGDMTAAATAATVLCTTCGSSSGFAVLARQAFANANAEADFDAACPHSPPPSAPLAEGVMPPPPSFPMRSPPEDSAAPFGRHAHSPVLPTVLALVACVLSRLRA